jgi:hypothetical protein
MKKNESDSESEAPGATQMDEQEGKSSGADLYLQP